MSEELFAAIKQHDTARVTALLASGADPNAPQTEWPALCPLNAAISELAFGGSLDMVRVLIDHGADVNGWNGPEDVPPLVLAVSDEQQKAVELLLTRGADPNVCSSEGDSPLRLCARMGHLSMAGLLLDAGANRTINEWGGLHGCTALGFAAQRLDTPMIKLLLDAGADPGMPDDGYKTAQERLPPRDASDPNVWDEAFKLLQATKGHDL